MNLRDQLTSVENQLAEEKSNLNKNPELIAQLEERQASLEQQIMIQEDAMKSAQIQQQVTAAAETTTSIAPQYDFAIDFNDIFGTTLLNDEIQKLLDGQREQLHTYYMTLQEDRDTQIRELRKEVDVVNEENKTLLVAKGNAELERDDFKKRFENSGELIKELQSEVARLKEREMELLEAAEKAPLLYPHKVIDVTPNNMNAGDIIREQRAKELAAKPKVWDLQWVDELKKTEYKGVAEDGSELIIKRLELGKYNVQVGPRPEQTSTEVVAEVVQDSVTPEASFPELPKAELPTLPTGLDQGQPSGEVPTANAGQGQTVEERLSALEARVFGYVKAS